MLLLWEKMLSGSHKINTERNEELDKNNGDYFGFRKMKKANEEKRKEIECMESEQNMCDTNPFNDSRFGG